MLPESMDVKPLEGPAQAGLPPSGAPPKKKGRAWIWVVLVAVLAVCLCVVVVGAGAMLFTDQGKSLTAQLVAYFISPTPTATATPTATPRPTATPTPRPTLTPTSIPIPQECGMSSPYFGPIHIGTLVILGRHRPVDGFANWVEDMQAYVGRQARVTSLAGLDSGGCPVVNVDVDGGAWYWRIRDMTIVE